MAKNQNKNEAKISRVAGPVVVAEGLHAKMYDVVRVGDERLMGEVIKIDNEDTIIQVYEDTTGIKPGEPVENTHQRLSVELGPGLLTSIYDGIQRPLPILEKQMGNFIERGVDAPGIDQHKKWTFKATAKKGDEVKGGDIIGEVKETPHFTHKIMIPPNIKGKIKTINSGEFTVQEMVCQLENGEEIKLSQKWPVRSPRPMIRKQTPSEPLLTGQRVFDVFFPLAKGGAAAIPGPFGAGKTVSQQQIAKWCDADIIVYVGCGERGNEMTEVLTEFPDLKDPRTNGPLMNRTILIANTSNMPVAAREASVYTGVTIAEYFRDQGYNVAMMADSTSRWAEAMREISSRLEEMPGEEGYPAYLSTRLSEFYERAGMVETLNKQKGSVSIIGAVSPPGGDFSEPVTQNTLRVTKTFWALDAKLAGKRHYPSVNWLTSYTLYNDNLEEWQRKNVATDWKETLTKLMSVLQEEEKLLEIVQLVGSDSLPPRQQLTLEIARLVREYILQQNAFHEFDTYSSMEKAYMIAKTILKYSELATNSLEKGARFEDLLIDARDKIGQAKFIEDYKKHLETVQKEIEEELTQ